ncbi:MAG: Ig-like domain-containing protein [Opitutales bacterium]|jgi:hypothetical protein
MDESTLQSRFKRSIRRPFFLLTTPDRNGSYFQKENYRVLMSRREKIAAFLAPASMGEGGADARGRAVQEVTYDLAEFGQNIEQMESLPAAVVEAFADAARAFCEGNERSVDHELKLRRGFRLPDPELDPQAYYVYGPTEDRRLVILWGTEIKQDSSLPLCRDSDYVGLTIVDKLRARVMGPASMRAQALKLLDRSTHPLARFIAGEVRGGDGKLRELVSTGKRIPLSKAKRMKYLPKAEIAAFEAAARQYYEEAHPDAEGLSAYEKELRASMRLPDLHRSPLAYYRCGGKLLVACSPKDDYDSCLCLTSDSVLGLPVEGEDSAGRRIVPPTVLGQLEERATPVKLYASVGVVSALLLVGLVTVGIAMLDHKPPELQGSPLTTEQISATTHRDTPGRIRLVWSEDIDPKSVEPSALPGALKTFYLIDEDGRPIDIAKVQLNKNVIDLYLPEERQMLDGRRYKLEISNIADTSMNHNVIKSGTRVEVEYNDTVAPVVSTISAEGSDSRKLRLEFNEPLEKFGAENAGNYQVEDFSVIKAEYQADTNSVILTCEKRNPNVVDKGFADGGMYRITVANGITDASVKRNRPDASVTKSFKYVDTVPPRLVDAKATSQTEINAVFSEPVKVAGVSTSAFRILQGEDVLEVDSAELLADNLTVKLGCAPLFNGKEYILEARGISDAKDNAIPEEMPSTDSFRFDGREDKSPPEIVSADFIKDDAAGSKTNIRVVFNESIDKACAVPANFEVVSFTGSVPVADVQASGLKNNEFVIVLGIPAGNGDNLFIRASNIADRLGNKALLLKSAQFMPRGTSPMLPQDLSPTGCKINAPDSVTLLFNENLDPDSAKDSKHYFYSGSARVDAVSFDPNTPNRVVLHLSSPVAEAGQTVTAHSLCLENDSPQEQASVTFKLMP